MSLENVKRFYELLELDEALRKEALSFQQQYSEQEKVMEAFVALAERNGLSFSHNDLVEYIFHHGTEVSE